MTSQKLNRISSVEESQSTNNTVASASVGSTFPIVGIVGAAGSRQALEKFFRTLPTDAGMAFVVVTRLAAKQQRVLVKALEARTDLPVLVANDRTAIQIDHIYLAPPGMQITLEQGQLCLQPTARATTETLLNAFLTSLALDGGENAVAVLLSGVGEDGITGLQQVKARGGLTLVQEPDDAAHATLPRRAIEAGLADLVGKAGELTQLLVQNKGDLSNVPATSQESDEHFHQNLMAVLSQITTQTGHDLSHYKLSTLQRRILRRMGVAGASSLGQYLDLLKINLSETINLFRDCLVSVTSFFRDPDAYEMLERDCIPQLFQGKGHTDFVRVWIAGCATGEEAYSVAIQLAERAAQIKEPPRFQIFATDLDAEAIAIARHGLYPATVAKDIAPSRLQRYFVEENGYYRIKSEIRECILFAVHDLLQDPPFSRLDLICCRNVLIYFTRTAQEKVFAIFHYALNAGGYLFLGGAESVDAASDLFAVLHKHCHLYQRRQVTTAPPRRSLGTATTSPLATQEGKTGGRMLQRPADKPRTIEEMYAAWSLRAHTPARLLVNQQYDITHLFGGADRYLQAQDGAITQNVLQKIHPDLRLDLRAALYQVFSKGESSISRALSVTVDNHTQSVQLHVGLVNEPGFPQDYAEVVFVVQATPTPLNLTAPAATIETDMALVTHLEEELLRTRERLRNVIEEYEVSGQELKASNEELQSINEELKSTTEELETSKEELQSMNEELTTVNGELTHKIEELHRANSDLLNFIATTDVGAIFLDDHLRIKRFTPRATDLFNLIEGDVGRPFAHLTHRLRHTELTALAAHVHEQTVRMEETVQRDDDRWFMLRLFPYRTVTGEIDGVVITFVDINDLKRAESEERQRRQQQTLVELSRQALIGSDLAHLLRTATQRIAEVLDMELCKVLELQPDGKTLLLKAGVGWREGLVGQATISADASLQAGYTLQFQAPVIVRDLRTETRFRGQDMLAEHNVRSGMSVTIPWPDASKGAYGVLSVHSRQLHTFATYDVDFLQSVANLLATTIMRRQTEAALRAQERRYHFIFESAGVSIWEEDFTAIKALLDRFKAQGIDDLRTYLTTTPAVARQALALRTVRDINRHTLTLFGAERKEQLLAAPQQILLPESESAFCEAILTLADGRHYYETETTVQTLQGERRHVFFTITFPEDNTKLERALVSLVDITKRKEGEAVLARYQLLSEQTREIILFMRLDGQLVEANAAAVEAYGYDRATLLQMGIHDLRAPTTQTLIDEQMRQANQSDPGRGIRFETVHRHRDGHTFPVEVSSIGADVGDERLLMSVIRDISERKAAEAALTASEAKFATAFSLSPLFLTITTLADGRLVEVNEGFVDMSGYTRAEALGRTPDELGLWVNQHERQVGLARLHADGIVKDVEADFRMKDGSIRTCLLGASIIDINGQPCALTALTDITERKAAEAALRQSEERFVTIFQRSPYPIAILALADGCYVDVNPTWERDTGYTRDEVIGRKPLELGLQAEPTLQLRQRLEEEGAIRNLEIQTRMRNGQYRTAIMSAELIQLYGEPHALLVFTDITQRKVAEAALRASETQLRLVTDNTSGLISYVDREQCYRFVNAIYEQWFAQPRAQIINRTVQAVLGDAAYAVAQPHLAQVLAGERVTFENTITYPDGLTRTVLTTYVPDISGQDAQADQVIGFYALVTDITARKQAEDRLHFLAEASTMLASSLDYTITLQNVARAAVPRIADWCVIDLLAEDGSFQPGVIAHRDPSKVRWAEELRERYPIDPNGHVGAPQVIRTGQAELYPEISDAVLQAVAKNEIELQLLRSVGYRSVMIVPLQTNGRMLGAITFVTTEAERHFDTEDLTMAAELAQRASSAIGNAQLHQALQQREQALGASEERLRLATAAGKIGIYDYDLRTDQTIFSDIYHFITGIPADKLLTRETWLGYVHPDDRAAVAEKLQRAITANESYDYEYRIYRPDGVLCWLGVSSRVTVDEDGQAIRLTGAVRDITERKQAEEEIQRLNRDLKRRLDELQALFDVAPIGIFVAHDPTCEVITGNPVGNKMLGLDSLENASKSKPGAALLPFRVMQNGREVPPEELPMQYAVRHDVTVKNLEVDIVRSDGSVLNLYEYAIPLHDEEGKVRGCLGIFVDITERKQAELSLRESEERFRSAFEQAAVGMAHVSLDGQYVRVNERLCTILGYERAELLQRNFIELTHVDDRANSLALSERLLAGAIPSYSVEKRYLRRDGSTIWVNINASVVRNAADEIKYRLSVIEDISARKAAEAALYELAATLEQRVHERTLELQRSNYELDQFAYVASHDLKAPLRAIVNLAAWIVEDASDRLPAPSLEHLQKLRGRALRMDRLLDDLLTYSRIGRQDGIVEEVKTDLLLQDTIELLALPPGFVVTLTGPLPVLVTPRAPLEIIFRNLLNNAIKHHRQPTQGIVEIGANDLGDFVEFVIRDNGPGIDPQHHERIFGMFQTLRPRDEVEGSGMGLAIVKKTVEYRGGVVRIESALGAGATFRFTWPKRITKQTE